MEAVLVNFNNLLQTKAQQSLFFVQKHPIFLSKKHVSRVQNGKWLLAHLFHWHYLAFTLTDSINYTDFGPDGTPTLHWRKDYSPSTGRHYVQWPQPPLDIFLLQIGYIRNSLLSSPLPSTAECRWSGLIFLEQVRGSFAPVIGLSVLERHVERKIQASGMLLDLEEYSDTSFINMDDLSSNSRSGLSNSATLPEKQSIVIIMVYIQKIEKPCDCSGKNSLKLKNNNNRTS